MTQVYECRPSCEDHRPQIDFQNAVTASNDWLQVGKVLDGQRRPEEFPSNVNVYVADHRATEWDSFMVAGTRGLFSQRFVDTVGKPAFQGLTLLPAKLNGATYYFLRCEEPVDCLDRSNAAFVTFRSDPKAIQRITHYAFHSESLPADACFVLPELPDLLLTESVAQRLQAVNLKGVRVQPLP
ncbi:MAG: hypothetical protein NT069_08605 [Planctomycetota bacterium]|nr:hypothetical protein [Planctomycetota bacterium]